MDFLAVKIFYYIGSDAKDVDENVPKYSLALRKRLTKISYPSKYLRKFKV